MLTDLNIYTDLVYMIFLLPKLRHAVGFFLNGKIAKLKIGIKFKLGNQSLKSENMLSHFPFFYLVHYFWRREKKTNYRLH